MKTSAILVPRHPPAAQPRLATRLPYFVTLMKPRVMAFAVFTAFVGMMVLAATGISALAAYPYDGTWHVNITTTAGTCGSGVGFNLQVRNGTVYGYGDFRVSGRVTPRGDARVAIMSGQSQATGSGRLRGSSGGGSWHGGGSQGLCSGYWNANRV